MTSQLERSRRATSQRPSRLGAIAGTSSRPACPVTADTGFPALLRHVWQRAVEAPDLAAAVDVLLTLAGHVPADVRLRALSRAEEIALDVLTGLRWRPEGSSGPVTGAGQAFPGEIGLSTSGRLVIRVPSHGPLGDSVDLVGGVLPVPWSAPAVAEYLRAKALADQRHAESVVDCRTWLADLGDDRLAEVLDQLTRAALRTAPFVLYHEDRQYTNFRDRNTLTGKTLPPGHPHCALSALDGVPVDRWSDSDVLLVVSLTLLVRSGGYGRIEEANGTQLTVAHVAHLLETIRGRYNAASDRPDVPPVGSTRVADLFRLADALRERRAELRGEVQLYREIHGVLMHKVERVAGPFDLPARRREDAVCARLSDVLPITGHTLAELGAELAADPTWLCLPTGAFDTGLAALVHAAVTAATGAFAADFAMSRGIRSLPRLVAALRARDWAKIVDWDINHYFCCVVPAPDAVEHFDGSAARLADAAWAMSSRMRYNSWHFIAGNLPKVPGVEDRDYFVPPTMPDVAFFADQHHNGHVANHVRFSIRGPQPVRVLDRVFDGFVDLRLLRCDGPPFHEQDVLAAHRLSELVAEATTLAARLVADGTDIEITGFDSRWHWTTITGDAS